MNDVSVMHFSKLLEVLGGLLLPGKHINSSMADAVKENSRGAHSSSN